MTLLDRTARIDCFFVSTCLLPLPHPVQKTSFSQLSDLIPQADSKSAVEFRTRFEYVKLFTGKSGWDMDGSNFGVSVPDLFRDRRFLRTLHQKKLRCLPLRSCRVQSCMTMGWHTAVRIKLDKIVRQCSVLRHTRARPSVLNPRFLNSRANVSLDLQVQPPPSIKDASSFEHSAPPGQ